VETLLFIFRTYFSPRLLYLEVENTDADKFGAVFRMSPEVLDILLKRVRPAIEKQDTVMRQAVPAKIRLMVTLTYLTSGANFHVMEDLYRISYSTISKIVPEVCAAIWESLSADYIKCPRIPDEWKEKAREFTELWDYPRGLAAIDGKHVVVQVHIKHDTS
jgi:hypothetical protein